MMERGYEDLDAWKVGMLLVRQVYEVTEALPKAEMFGLKSQLRRAAVSVPSNIAEGNASGTDGLYLRHVRIARGSVAEIHTQVLLMRELFPEVGGISDLLRIIDRVARLTTGLRNHLERRHGA